MQLFQRQSENSFHLRPGKLGIVTSAIKRQLWWWIWSLAFVVLMAYQFHSMQELVLHLQLPSISHVDLIETNNHHHNYHQENDSNYNDNIHPTVANHSTPMSTISTVEPTSMDHADPVTMEKLQRAGLDPTVLDSDTLRRIPKWHRIQTFLGSSSPHVVGLETCAKFQEIVESGERFVGGTLEESEASMNVRASWNTRIA